MTKPRFTPDPPPVGIDPEVHEYLLRQLDRVSDLWPKDIENRLAHLEKIQTAKTGRWPIVDSSLVNFGLLQIGEASACFTGLYGSLIDSSNQENYYACDVMYDELNNQIIYAMVSDAFAGFWQCAYVSIDCSDDTVTGRCFGYHSSRTGMTIGSSKNTWPFKDTLFITTWNSGATRAFFEVDLATWGIIAAQGQGNYNMQIGAETQSRIFMARFQSGASRGYWQKGVGYAGNCSLPSTDWSWGGTGHGGSIGIGRESALDPEGFLHLLWKKSTSEWYIQKTNSSVTSFPTPTTKFGVETHLPAGAVSGQYACGIYKPVMVGEKIYWPVHVDSAANTFERGAWVIVTDLDGYTLAAHNMFNSSASWPSNSSHPAFHYNERSGEFYWNSGSSMCVWKKDSPDFATCCAIGYENDWGDNIIYCPQNGAWYAHRNDGTGALTDKQLFYKVTRT